MCGGNIIAKTEQAFTSNRNFKENGKFSQARPGMRAMWAAWQGRAVWVKLLAAQGYCQGRDHTRQGLRRKLGPLELFQVGKGSCRPGAGSSLHEQGQSLSEDKALYERKGRGCGELESCAMDICMGTYGGCHAWFAVNWLRDSCLPASGDMLVRRRPCLRWDGGTRS